MKRQFLGMGLFLFIFAAGQTRAALPDGKSIANKVYDRNVGQDSYFKVEMILINKMGLNQTRRLIMAYKNKGPLRHSYTRFTLPADIDGTSFLSVQKTPSKEDQFLYLPELGRDRRIVSSQKDHSFVNTDFTYEDMERRSVDRDSHRTIKEEKISGFDCWVVESTPAPGEASQYSRRMLWIAKESLIPLRVDLYGKKSNTLIKQVTVSKIQKIQNIWTVMESTMNDLEENHRTTLRVIEAKYNVGLPDAMFTRDYLKQPR